MQRHGLVSKVARDNMELLLLAGLAGFAAASCSSEPDTSRVRNWSAPAIVGDLDNSRAVNVVDLQLLVNVALGTNTDPNVVDRADMDDNGPTNVVDVQRLVNLLLGCGAGNDACTCTVKPPPGVTDASSAVASPARYFGKYRQHFAAG